MQANKLLKKLALPLLLLSLLLTLRVLWQIFSLPEPAELTLILKQYFQQYGYWVLFFSAILEAALIIGFYYPGSFIIFLGVIVAGKNVGQIAAVVAIVTLAFLLGLSLDYWLGKYGWYKFFLKLGFKEELVKAQKRLSRYGALAIFGTYWEVNISSFTATAAGTLLFPYRKFLAYSFPAALLWNSFWATIIYFVGLNTINLVSGQSIYPFIVIGLWIIAILIRYWYQAKFASYDSQQGF